MMFNKDISGQSTSLGYGSVRRLGDPKISITIMSREGISSVGTQYVGHDGRDWGYAR